MKKIKDTNASPLFSPQAIAILLLTITTIIGVWQLGDQTAEKITSTQSRWHSYNYNSNNVNILLSELQELIGYGGYIHTFKNWVLRRDPMSLRRLQEQYAAITIALQAYHKLPGLTEQEQLALTRIETVFNAYDARLQLSLQQENLDLPPRELDPLVRVDDRPALEAITILREANRLRMASHTSATEQSISEALQIIQLRYLMLPILLFGTYLLIRYMHKTGRRTRELHAAEQRLDAIIETTPQPILIVNAHGVITRANQKAHLLFGCTESGLEGRTVESLMPPEYRHAHLGHRNGYISSQQARQSADLPREMPVLTLDGRHIPVETSLAYLDGEDGPLVIATIYDLTERKATERLINDARIVAETATRAKSSFLANMSHEIRTPMNAIIGMSHLVLQGGLATKQREQVEKINFAARSLLGIINGILDFSRIESGQLPLEHSDFRLEDLLDNIINLLGHQAEGKGLQLQTEISPSTPTALTGDSLRLGQIALNLVNNAIKFTPPGGKINLTVNAEQSDDGFTLIHFAVRDTGIGISKEQQQQLFKPFSQADESTTRQYGGSGLGLAISKNLTQLMGGEIWLESEPGCGSTFHFTVRLARQQGEPSPRTINAPGIEKGYQQAAAQLRGALLLLVEDNEVNQELMLELLNSHGISVEVAVNGEEALNILATQTFDGVLMDCQMPVMDGYEATRKIRQQPALQSLPIIALTANTMAGDREKVIEAGMNDHIAKPIDVTQLFITLAKWIRSRSDRQQSLAQTGRFSSDDGDASDTPVIPVLPGIDTNAGLRLTMDNRSLFIHLLRKFHTLLRDTGGALLQAMEHQEYEEMLRLAHSLKGTAASLGAHDIAEAALLLEQACRDSSDNGETLQALLQALLQLDRSTMEALEKNDLVE